MKENTESMNTESMNETLLLTVLDKAMELNMTVEDLEKEYIRSALVKCRGKKSETAQVLGLGIKQLYNKMERYDLDKFRRRMLSCFKAIDKRNARTKNQS